MPLLDLLGTFAGAAFLAGSVTLAIRVDRREAATAERLQGRAGVRASVGLPAEARQLRLLTNRGE